MYDPETVETISGEIIKVEKVSGRGGGGGLHLIVKTDKETIPVHLGPRWYLDDKDVSFRVADRVEVKGSRINDDDETAIIAAQIKRGDDVVKLRNEDGIPKWAGRGRSF
jgi:hypothetical protein